MFMSGTRARVLDGQGGPGLPPCSPLPQAESRPGGVEGEGVGLLGGQVGLSEQETWRWDPS